MKSEIMNHKKMWRGELKLLHNFSDHNNMLPKSSINTFHVQLTVTLKYIRVPSIKRNHQHQSVSSLKVKHN